MKRYDEIKDMLAYSDNLLAEILRLHGELLAGAEEKLKFQIQIKFFLELMSSCLDYLAMDMVEAYGETVKPNNINFPIPRQHDGEDMTTFEKNLKKELKKHIGNNSQADLELIHLIRKHESSFSRSFWFVDFVTLRNNNAHRNLSLHEEKIDDDRVIGFPNGDKVELVGEMSGFMFGGINDLISSKKDLKKHFNAPVEEMITKYYIFKETHPFNQKIVDFLPQVKNLVEDMIDEIYLHLKTKKQISI